MWKYKGTDIIVKIGDCVQVSAKWAKEYNASRNGVVSGLNGFITVAVDRVGNVDFDARSLTFIKRKEEPLKPLKRVCALSEVKEGEVFSAQIAGSLGLFIKINDSGGNVLNTSSWRLGSIAENVQVEVLGQTDIKKY